MAPVRHTNLFAHRKSTKREINLERTALWPFTLFYGSVTVNTFPATQHLRTSAAKGRIVTSQSAELSRLSPAVAPPALFLARSFIRSSFSPSISWAQLRIIPAPARLRWEPSPSTSAWDRISCTRPSAGRASALYCEPRRVGRNIMVGLLLGWADQEPT